MPGELTKAFHRSVDEGVTRLERPVSSLAATGMVGGLDVSVGVVALLIVESGTGQPLLGALAFGVGFVALTLANSELFTENFLVPVAAVVAKNARWWAVLRLWTGTLVLNLVGAWVATGIVVMALPRLKPTVEAVGSRPIDLGIDRVSFASAVLAGALITLMTWMERSTESVPAKLISAWSVAFVLAAGPLQHAVVISAEAFAALHGGAPFGYYDWLRALGWAVLGNVLGGLGLVTVLRLVQVGGEELQRERARPKDDHRAEDADTVAG